MSATAAPDVNREYYGKAPPGLQDYWRRMAAPRLRVATLLRLLKEDPPLKVVDLGCGGGQLLAEVAAAWPGAELAGIDLSEKQIEANREAMPGIEWQAVDLERPDAIHPAQAGRFDAVIASEIVEHLRDPVRFLRSALSLAVPGRGRLLLSTQSGPVRETERRVGHLRHFSAPEMESLLREAGWGLDRTWNCGWPFHDLSKWWANVDPDATMHRFSDRPYGPAERLVCALLRGAFRLNSGRRGAQLFAVARRPA